MTDEQLAEIKEVFRVNEHIGLPTGVALGKALIEIARLTAELVEAEKARDTYALESDAFSKTVLSLEAELAEANRKLELLPALEAAARVFVAFHSELSVYTKRLINPPRDPDRRIIDDAREAIAAIDRAREERGENDGKV